MQTDLRYEAKFLGYEGDLDGILLWLCNTAVGHKKVYPDRKVNSIYFDSPDLRAIQDNLDGISNRQKLRYRWYGKSFYPTSGYLELKKRRNSYGSKDLFPVNEMKLSPQMNWKEFKESLSDHVGTEGRALLSTVGHPSLIVSYDRSYYLSADKKIRVTIDKNINFYEQHSSLRPNFRKQRQMDPIIVVEVKCDRSHREAAADIVKNIPIRNSRCSKYVMGVI